MVIKHFPIFLVIALILFGTGCKDDTSEGFQHPNAEFNDFIKKIMKKEKWYLWHDLVKEVNINSIKDPAEYLDAMTYKLLDRWSYIESYESFSQYFDEGKYIGYGIGFETDAENKLFISYVYDDSPLRQHGVERGWEILKLNGQSVGSLLGDKKFNSAWGDNREGVVTKITLKKPSGEIVDISAEKELITQNSVLNSSTHTLGNGDKVGYVSIESFIGTTVNDLKPIFMNFKSEGIKHLIVDLRYNGGGLVDASHEVANMIVGNKASGKVFEKYLHNETKSSENSELIFEPTAETVDLDKVVFITTEATASASELLINGIKPHIDIALVGNRTHGKPVGMYSFRFANKVLVPVCFRMVNSDGEGDFFDGIGVNSQKPDGFDKPLGNKEESCLKEALYFLETGGFTGTAAKKTARKRILQKRKGMKGVMGSY